MTMSFRTLKGERTLTHSTHQIFRCLNATGKGGRSVSDKNLDTALPKLV